MKKEIHEPIEVGNDNERIIKELAQHVNMLVQRVMSTEIALDACLSLLSEKDENFMDNFSLSLTTIHIIYQIKMQKLLWLLEQKYILIL